MLDLVGRWSKTQMMWDLMTYLELQLQCQKTQVQGPALPAPEADDVGLDDMLQATMLETQTQKTQHCHHLNQQQQRRLTLNLFR